MSDELVKRLRDLDRYVMAPGTKAALMEAADRIEALEAELAKTDELGLSVIKADARAMEELEADLHANAKTFAALIAEERAKTAAERALADQLADALTTVGTPEQRFVVIRAALAAYRAARSEVEQ